MEIAILTPEELESDYGIKLSKKMACRMAAFHHWLANPDPNYPTSNHRRLADMDRNKFEQYMMTEWRKPKAPPQSQDPQVAESAGFQPDVGIRNQPTIRILKREPLKSMMRAIVPTNKESNNSV
eukprot:scaffold133_cov169-Amphora_coffeaeformis.AAC.8